MLPRLRCMLIPIRVYSGSFAGYLIPLRLYPLIKES
ncbi:hypothetical protein CHELA20_50077 [Hyphomicrobiales bacterium]|nr:hypothetical protein CHELA41_20295 [Hyphomicrobiales bacterium]CAH1666524.1 hypothetical protein CHELA20_50077 [Hyphomicrobiales bacterium]